MCGAPAIAWQDDGTDKYKTNSYEPGWPQQDDALWQTRWPCVVI